MQNCANRPRHPDHYPPYPANKSAGYEPKRRDPTYDQQQTIFAGPWFVCPFSWRLDGYEKLRKSREIEKTERTAEENPLTTVASSAKLFVTSHDEEKHKKASKSLT